MRTLLSATREKLGRAPRSIAHVPSWAFGSYADTWQRLLQTGQLVWAFSVNPDNPSGPITFVYAADAEFDPMLFRLEGIASRVRSTARPLTGELAPVEELLSGLRTRRVRLPQPIARDAVVFAAATTIRTSELPRHVSLPPFVPMLTAGDVEEIAPLPLALWAPDLAAAWPELGA
jgi:hypothetical protein